MDTDPLLSNPPAFVLLAVAVALAAYLRQMSEAREKSFDEIAAGDDEKFPLGAPHTEKRLSYLESSRQKLNGVAPPVIFLTIVIAFRLMLLAGMKLFASETPKLVDALFRWIDFAAMLFISCLFVALWYMHRKARQKNEEIRAMTKGWRAGILASARNLDDSSGKNQKQKSNQVLELPDGSDLASR
jgi:hypothetical protein